MVARVAGGMVDPLLVLGVLAATFVGFNIGGSSTGVAWGPAVGAQIINKTLAAAVMTFFVFLGGWTIGRNVIATLGGDLVPQSAFTLGASIVVLGFIGLGMLVSNVYGVPVSTSMTAVGSIAGFGLATGELDQAVLGGIVVWWIVAPVTGFWCGGMVGRYLYPTLDRKFAIQQSEGPFVVYDWRGPVPVPAFGPGTTQREFVSTMVVFAIACYMSFSAGASNVANAVAPLVGGGAVSIGAGVLLATVGIGLGAFTIARRTMESVGNDITALPLLAAAIVMVIASTITTIASYLGVPLSLAMATVMTIVGLGWGRATRTATAKDLVAGTAQTEITVAAIAAETPEEPTPIGEESPEDLRSATELFDAGSVVRFIFFWILGPGMATLLTWAVFAAGVELGLV